MLATREIYRKIDPKKPSPLTDDTLEALSNMASKYLTSATLVICSSTQPFNVAYTSDSSELPKIMKQNYEFAQLLNQKNTKAVICSLLHNAPLDTGALKAPTRSTEVVVLKLANAQIERECKKNKSKNLAKKPLTFSMCTAAEVETDKSVPSKTDTVPLVSQDASHAEQVPHVSPVAAPAGIDDTVLPDDGHQECKSDGNVNLSQINCDNLTDVLDRLSSQVEVLNLQLENKNTLQKANNDALMCLTGHITDRLQP
jgi:hypothetical protein